MFRQRAKHQEVLTICRASLFVQWNRLGAILSGGLRTPVWVENQNDKGDRKTDCRLFVLERVLAGIFVDGRSKNRK